jgi:hypothetical protein
LSSNWKASQQLSFYVAYLMMLSVFRLYNAIDRMINECGAVGGMRIGRRN